ncbi:NADH:flavin oxidoreductase/NADH oxidase [Cellulomonas bogoriensis]|uniref:Oxidoreductase n=1 Tax=Cellulomonas bogoriensis 69B4 = DSM 16987 TaxID=1386082 RepID=A0A0A0BUX0_9CELL|nr:NADH:flavin oxidoreductase/NADH oxidase [Cellulomonas bogoriensis]KGM11507.1 oxidoreductase [Cellulomonas bogoriensis 69B4 = DSM 16987]
MSRLFTPLTLRGVTVRNRVWLAPMCQYSAQDGMPGPWHLVHLAARGTGGFGLVMTEAAAVLPEGRITPQDAGIWDEAHVQGWRQVTDALHAQGATAAVQLAHAGRKASTHRPWDARTGSVPAADGGWPTVGPSEVPFDGLDAPGELSPGGIEQVVDAFALAAARAVRAGFDVVEVHAAHGYLLHQFLSPLSNHRRDDYGGTLQNRARLLLDVAGAVRVALPDDVPLLVRVSATDWVEGGLTVQDVGTVATWLAALGVDLVDVSSGGNVPARIPVGPGYQVPLARSVRAASGLAVSAVGMITSGAQAEQVLVDGAADAVMIGRPALLDPMWALRAARELGVAPDADGPAPVPAQYLRGAWT